MSNAFTEAIAAEASKAVVKWYNSAQKYGFLIDDKPGDIMFHRDAVRVDGVKVIRPGDEAVALVIDIEPGKRRAAIITSIKSPKAADGANMEAGVVKFYSRRGYGVIASEGKPDVWFHARHLRESGLLHMKEGSAIKFVRASGPKGDFALKLSA